MKTLIVGANGFLAAALSEQLGGTSARLTGVYRQNQDRITEAHYEELLPVEALSELGKSYDVIFLLAAFIPYGKLNVPDPRFYETNVALVEQICAQFPSSRIIFASSTSVYGKANGPLSETSPPEPTSLYGQSKHDAERLVEQASSYASLRYSSLYGLGMAPHGFLPRLMQQARSEGKLTLWGSGDRRQDYLHVTDAARLLVSAAHITTNGTFLGVYGNSYSNLEVAQRVRALAGEIPIVHVNEDPSPHFVYDASFSHRILDFRPRVSLEQGIEELFLHETK